MSKDYVHDMQRAYRKLIRTIAEPGKMVNIHGESNRIETYLEGYQGTYTLMEMLLDNEVTFRVVSKQEEAVMQMVKQLTYGKACLNEEADYWFVLRSASAEELDEVIRRAKIGCSVNPHLSATIVVEAEKISKEKVLQLTGPGIRHHHFARIEVAGNWIREREKKNQEFPMGVDMIFIDEDNNLMAIPRTTQIREKEVI